MTILTRENQKALDLLLEYAGSSALLEQALQKALSIHGPDTEISDVVQVIRELKQHIAKESLAPAR